MVWMLLFERFKNETVLMNSYGLWSAVALLSAICAFPCYAFTAGSLTGSSVTEFSNCSELVSSVDRDVCSHHLAVFKALIREKNNQIPPVTSSPSTSSGIPRSSPPAAAPIPETVLIRKVSATTSRLDHEVFQTVYPTLFIFDAEQSPGKGQPAVYELPLSEPVSDSIRRVNGFQLPDNSAFVGNRVDILPEFVIEGGIESHYVISATHNDSVYYLANIEVDSRHPLDSDDSSAMATTGHPGTTPAKGDYIPAGILELRGAGIFVADNIRVVLDPADNDMRIRPVDLGCSNYGEFGTEENFVYRFVHSAFDLLKGVPGSTNTQNAALSVRCFQKKGQVQLTMKNTQTVIAVPTETDPPTPVSPQSSGVLFSIYLWPRENVLSFVDSTCNSVVDQFGNDLSIDSAHPSDPDHYMGGVLRNHCSGIKMMNGAFGLKDREQAWGWVSFDDADKRRCWAVNGKRYRAGFASLSAWSSAGFDVACNGTMPTAISSASSFLSASATVSPNTTKLISDADNTSDPVISVVEGWLTNGCPCSHIACKALILLGVLNFLF